MRRGGLVLLALPESLEESAGAIAEDVQREPGKGGSVSVGIGPLGKDFGEMHRAAAACLALSRDRGVAGSVVEFDALGPLRFLLDASEMGQSAAMIREALDPVVAHDAGARTPLLPTLRAFVECNGHYEASAGRLYISVSTLKYRLRILREVLGTSPSDPELQFRLRLAFGLMDLMEAIEAAPSPRPGRQHSPRSPATSSSVTPVEEAGGGLAS